VKKYNYLLLAFFTTACVSYKKYNQQEILNQKLDFDGRVVTKTFRQWISHPDGDRLATTTQEFDSVGRLVKEYGFNNPYHYNAKYLEERLYSGSQVYVLNKYLWPKGDTTNNFSNYDKQLHEEFIYPDSLNRKKSVTITLWPINGDTLVAHFEETFPISANSWTSKSFSFKVHKNDIKFDGERKLITANLKK
jgi:hypothetical protein